MPNDVKPSPLATTLHYLGASERTFGFILKEKNPSTLKEAQDMAKNIERNVSSVGKVYLLGSNYSRSTQKSESRGKEVSNQLQNQIEAFTNVVSQMLKKQTSFEQVVKESNPSGNQPNIFWVNKSKNQQNPKGHSNNQTNIIQEGPSWLEGQKEDSTQDEDECHDEDMINYLDEEDLEDLDSINMVSTNQPI